MTGRLAVGAGAAPAMNCGGAPLASYADPQGSIEDHRKEHRHGGERFNRLALVG